jgi:hypothetical protein
MDDFSTSTLTQSKQEYTIRLLNILTPHILEGLQSIFEEADKLCVENGEAEKYLMTFQNFLSRIPQWNNVIIETERKRIVERSGCRHLEDLVTCTHILQLKLLTAIRVGTKQKKIDISIPSLDTFLHQVYIHTARTVWKNVYLFERDRTTQMQQNRHKLETLIQECIMNAIRDNIPVESILSQYLEETTEYNVTETLEEKVVAEPAGTVQAIDAQVAQEVSKVAPAPTPAPPAVQTATPWIPAPDPTKHLETEALLTSSSSSITDPANANANANVNEEDFRIKIGDMTEAPVLEVQTLSEPAPPAADPHAITLLPDLLLDDIEVLT